MGKEEKKEVEQKTEVETFSEAMDEVLKKAPMGDDTSPEKDDEVSEETITPEDTGEETPEFEEGAETELSEEDAEVIDGIDPEVLEVCRDYGWDDEKIVNVAKLTPELFEDVREVLDEEEEEELATPSAEEKKAEEDAKKAAEEEAIEELKFDLDPDVVGADVKAALDKIAASINEQHKGLSAEKSQLQLERDKAFNARIDDCLDKYSKRVPELGNTANHITRRQARFRQELFAYANVTASLQGIPIERAIRIEINKHQGQSGEKVAGQKLLNKLAKQKGRFTNTPTRRKSKAKERKFATEDEKIEAIMTEAYQEAGIED